MNSATDTAVVAHHLAVDVHLEVAVVPVREQVVMMRRRTALVTDDGSVRHRPVSLFAGPPLQRLAVEERDPAARDGPAILHDAVPAVAPLHATATTWRLLYARRLYANHS